MNAQWSQYEAFNAEHKATVMLTAKRTSAKGTLASCPESSASSSSSTTSSSQTVSQSRFAVIRPGVDLSEFAPPASALLPLKRSKSEDDIKAALFQLEVVSMQLNSPKHSPANCNTLGQFHNTNRHLLLPPKHPQHLSQGCSEHQHHPAATPTKGHRCELPDRKMSKSSSHEGFSMRPSLLRMKKIAQSAERSDDCKSPAEQVLGERCLFSASQGFHRADLFRPFLRDPEKPCILVLSRLVGSKNILTVLNAYGTSQELQHKVSDSHSYTNLSG